MVSFSGVVGLPCHTGLVVVCYLLCLLFVLVVFVARLLLVVFLVSVLVVGVVIWSV
jgi:hypothetical protein